ncbi:hypothetical protein BD779DRAFT_1601352, partial [Infundibulicybe gibba]
TPPATLLDPTQPASHALSRSHSCVPATPEHCEPYCALIGLNHHIYPLLHPLKLSTLKPVTSALHIMSATITHRHVTHKPTPALALTPLCSSFPSSPTCHPRAPSSARPSL